MYLENVREQYERYPYPPRDPGDERRRLLEVVMDRLAPVNFYCFKGRSKFEGARVLVAGGGTGDATIYLAEQLLSRNGEVVYVDISRASMGIARERAAIRKLGNIRWINDSLLALTPGQVGQFDYISCTGVLHHLDDPLRGLKTLRSVLKPGGAMGIMIYAKYGRTGVYQLQDLLRSINASETDLASKVESARRLLAQLPESNWFRMSERYLSDHKNLGDSGIVDLLLHEQDVAYTIDEAHALVRAAELHLVEFCDVKMRMLLKPEHFIRDDALLRKIGALDRIEQQKIAELFVGMVKQHIFYVSTSPDSQAILGDLSDIPFFLGRQYSDMGPRIAEAIRSGAGRFIPMRHESGFEINVAVDPICAAIFNQIDGLRDWREIFATARAELVSVQADDEDLLERFRPTFEQFRQLDWMLLRGAGVSAYPDTIEMQKQALRR